MKNTLPVTTITLKLFQNCWALYRHGAGGTGLFSEVHRDGVRGSGHQLQRGRVLVRCQETVFYHEGSQTGAQGGCGIADAGDTQNFIGHCPRC